MTPFEIMKRNWKTLNEAIGSSSYTITLRHVTGRFDSTSGCGIGIRNDTMRMLNGPRSNAKVYFDAIHSCALNAQRKIGEGKEDFDKVVEDFTKWCNDNNSTSGFGCPYKFYYPNFSIYNTSRFQILYQKIRMWFERADFVVHVVRDRCRDEGYGGYIIQIHCYRDKMSNYMPDYDPEGEEIHKKFQETFYENAAIFANNARVQCSILTNPTAFDRLFHWLRRCYVRYNSFLYGLYIDIKAAIKCQLFASN